RERQATVAADLVGSAALGDATRMIDDLPVKKSLPPGVKVSPARRGRTARPAAVDRAGSAVAGATLRRLGRAPSPARD
ncbi:MAG: hypothetical protein JSV48_06670, partial [Bradyrhizobium sp.]